MNDPPGPFPGPGPGVLILRVRVQVLPNRTRPKSDLFVQLNVIVLGSFLKFKKEKVNIFEKDKLFCAKPQYIFFL